MVLWCRILAKDMKTTKPLDKHKKNWKIHENEFSMMYIELYWLNLIARLDVVSFMEIVNQYDSQDNRKRGEVSGVNIVSRKLLVS